MSAKQTAALARLRTANAARRQADEEYRKALLAAAKAKENGTSWREIGEAAGLSAQGVISFLRRAGL